MPDKYRFFSDPGHAWLEVSAAEVQRLGILNKITGYSYVHKGNYYLEEDCDAPLWVEAKKAAGEAFEFIEIFQENTPIRNYRHVEPVEETWP